VVLRGAAAARQGRLIAMNIGACSACKSKISGKKVLETY
jgi:hypothetical protein